MSRPTFDPAGPELVVARTALAADAVPGTKSLPAPGNATRTTTARALNSASEASSATAPPPASPLLYVPDDLVLT